MATSQTTQNRDDILQLPTHLRLLSLNCWGLKFLSTHRHARLKEIAHQIASQSPPPEIVGLQECWTQEDYLTIRDITREILPHGKFYWSGVFGGGLVILSKWPIEESSMVRYPLNGRPAAFFRGDWFVGKGVACARIRIGGKGKGRGGVVEVFNTHLHAPYNEGAGKEDSYACHRTAQAWEIAKLMRAARERGSLVVGTGDFNMVPGSLAYGVVAGRGGGVRDVWRVVWPESARGSAEKGGLEGKVASSRECLDVHGTTCDSRLNTWRWSKALQKDLDRGREEHVDPEGEDWKAKRLDYIFFGDNAAEATGFSWQVEEVKVGMTMRHPELKCSLSDHFSVETTLVREQPDQPSTDNPRSQQPTLPASTYDQILSLITTYIARERRQRKQQLTLFWSSAVLTIACHIAIWWSPRNYVSFILMFLSTFGLGWGVLMGLMGFLFVKTELRALKEFRWEVERAREADGLIGGVGEGDGVVVDGDGKRSANS
ncbi:hypothetical protein M409DRAFT_16474 [Zasmidium cellare ATCC 36951]|uniref:Endonuclease/exonuclease/phosphatase domain-containing protein n=1 Tax=Zasmidium cellare ATCC 36951 TaxID=1080233 RepID=A0A6A6D483_ZASCE|nr:uncharacterized protein M409DRAFT_16474 [Zasmidium cellare ATCC 36951]KAF2174207.1 hypothetical protein M409DRAFT_16474 [Zasmidium cellare ATCC 36951]